MIEYNHLALLNERELAWIPSHFVIFQLQVQDTHKISIIRDWICRELNGRFCLAKISCINRNNKLTPSFVVAFEDPAELTMLLLSSAHI